MSFHVISESYFLLISDVVLEI